MLATTLVATVLIGLSSSAALPPADNRVNYYAYPRYIHFLFPVWLLAGLVALVQAGSKRALRLALAGAGLTVLTGLLVYLRVHAIRSAWFEAFDAPEIAFLGWRWNTLDVLRPMIVSLVGFGLVVLALRGRRAVMLPAVLGGLVAVSAAALVVSTARVIEPLSVHQYLPDTPRLVRDVHLGPGDRVALANREPTWYVLYNHMREVYWTRLEIFDQTKRPTPPADATVVIAPWQSAQAGARYAGLDWDGSRYGFHIVAVDREHHWAVWRKDRA